MVTQEQKAILIPIWRTSAWYPGRLKGNEEITGGANLLRAVTLGLCGREKELTEQEVHGLLLRLGAAFSQKDAQKLAPYLHGLDVVYNRSGKRLSVERIVPPNQSSDDGEVFYRFTKSPPKEVFI